MTENLRSHDDAELVALAQKGSATAFEALYDRHCAGVARALASFAGTDRDLLDDLTQDVFLKVVSNLASYTPSHPFPHWLFTIALNVGRNHARRQSKVVPVNPSDLEGFAAENERAVDATDELTAETLTAMVASLPVQMREVVSLRVGCDMSYADIAGTLGIPEGTARSRMHNAIKTMREKSGITRGGRRTENER